MYLNILKILKNFKFKRLWWRRNITEINFKNHNIILVIKAKGKWEQKLQKAYLIYEFMKNIFYLMIMRLFIE